jgi:hypothetical protein
MLDSEKVADLAMEIVRKQGKPIALAIHIACDGDPKAKKLVAAVLQARGVIAKRAKKPRTPRGLRVPTEEQVTAYRERHAYLYD